MCELHLPFLTEFPSRSPEILASVPTSQCVSVGLTLAAQLRVIGLTSGPVLFPEHRVRLHRAWLCCPSLSSEFPLCAHFHFSIPEQSRPDLSCRGPSLGAPNTPAVLQVFCIRLERLRLCAPTYNDGTCGQT